MRILIATPWFSFKTGYIENGLSKALVLLGHDVMIVTSRLQPGYALSNYQTVYAPFMGDAMQPLGECFAGGLRVVRLPHVRVRGQIALRRLTEVVKNFRPEIVQTFSVNTPLALQLAALQRRCGYSLFLGAHLPAVTDQSGRSLLKRPKLQRGLQFFTRWLTGRFSASRAQLCYAVTEDCALVASQVNGVPAVKIRRAPLGVDSSVYFPSRTPLERRQIRELYALGPEDIVCVYAGRFDEVKHPLLLAEAVRRLRDEGGPFRGLFIGGGPQAEALRSIPGMVVLPYMSQEDLAAHFRAADVAVWPFGYSSSQLDALACGLPLVLCDAIDDRMRVEGCGAVFRHGDAADLAMVLNSFRQSSRRERLGAVGASRIAASFTWLDEARRRCADYGAATALAVSSVIPS